MKKIAIFLTFLLSVAMYSQEEYTNQKEQILKSNEIKLNALVFVAGGLEVTYEHILNEETGIGISGMLPISKDVADEIKYYLSPFYRKYFGKKPASGFFVEGIGYLSRSDRDNVLFSSKKLYLTDFGLGIGFGNKWVSKKGLTAEIGLGIGRYLFQNQDNAINIFGKMGVSLGYQF